MPLFAFFPFSLSSLSSSSYFRSFVFDELLYCIPADTADSLLFCMGMFDHAFAVIPFNSIIRFSLFLYSIESSHAAGHANAVSHSHSLPSSYPWTTDLPFALYATWDETCFGSPLKILIPDTLLTGLFCRLILMSGSALSPLTISTEADFYTQSLAKAVNCDTSLEPSHLLECLRTKSVGELNKVNLGIDESFTTTFGPIIDGLLIPTDPRSLMESENSSSHHLTYQHPIGLKSGSSSITRSPSHSLLFGAVKTEAPSIFTDQEERTGIDAARRNRILYDLVKSMIDYYQEVSNWNAYENSHRNSWRECTACSIRCQSQRSMMLTKSRSFRSHTPPGIVCGGTTYKFSANAALKGLFFGKKHRRLRCSFYKQCSFAQSSRSRK